MRVRDKEGGCGETHREGESGHGVYRDIPSEMLP